MLKSLKILTFITRLDVKSEKITCNNLELFLRLSHRFSSFSNKNWFDFRRKAIRFLNWQNQGFDPTLRPSTRRWNINGDASVYADGCHGCSSIRPLLPFEWRKITSYFEHYDLSLWISTSIFSYSLNIKKIWVKQEYFFISRFPQSFGENNNMSTGWTNLLFPWDVSPGQPPGLVPLILMVSMSALCLLSQQNVALFDL